jgi:lysozyme family protein
MTSPNFARAIPILLEEEGGLADNPKDPGGLTKYGISQRSYPKVDIRALTPELAAAIYARDWWPACGADKLPWPLCLFVFDHAVNAGCVASIKCLQRAAHVKPDGNLGPLTLGAVERANLRLLCRQMNVERCRYYLSLDGFEHYGLAWIGRVASVAMKANWVS